MTKTTVIFIIISSITGGSTRNFGDVPLKEDLRSSLTTGLYDRNLGCHFGGRFYELEEEWHPDLGNPFGVMVCIKCKCQTVHKKRRITGKVTCKNFVDTCPTPQCDEPVLPPGKCCKMCPDAEPFEPMVFGSKPDAGDFNFDPGYHEFMALMTGRFKQPPVSTTGVGRAYVTLDRRNIHYSLYFDKLEELPTAVQIVDKNQGVLYEKVLDGRPVGNKVCGVWSNMPRVYFKSLKRGDVQIVLVTRKQPEGVIGGSLLKPKIVTREVYSSLLFAPSLDSVRNMGYGGTAAIDVQGSGDELVFGVWLNAAMRVDLGLPMYAILSLQKDDGRHKELKNVRAELTLKDGLYTSESRITLSGQEQRLLSRGKLSLVVTTDFTSPTEFVGLIVPKQSCDVYQAVLTEEINNEEARSTPNGTGGYALLEVSEDGALKFTIQTEGERRVPLSGFAIEKATRRNRRRMILQSRERVTFESGRSHGIVTDHVNVRELELLYKDKLLFEVTDVDGATALKGAVRRIVHSDAVEMQATPIVLSGQNVRPHPAQTLTAAVAWFSDPGPADDCALSYTVSIAGAAGLQADNVKLSLCHRQTSIADGCFANLTKFDFVNIDLSEAVLFGQVDYLSSQGWRLLTSADGGSYVLLTIVSEQKRSHLAGNLSLSNDQCWRRQVQRDLVVAEDHEANQAPRQTHCEYERVKYNDGDGWHAVNQECTMCSCQRGQIKCDAVVCPTLPCANPVRTPGDCCPSCPVDVGANPLSSSGPNGCFWTGDQRWHSPGSYWHPYLPPFGYSKCALCQCMANLTVSCSKTACPSLTCERRLRYRENPQDCCQKCRPAEQADPEPEPEAPVDRSGAALRDESVHGRCLFNDRWYEDGSQFAPKIAHLGAMKCVQCTCQRTRVICRRRDCSSASCNDVLRKNGCCPKCGPR